MEQWTEWTGGAGGPEDSPIGPPAHPPSVSETQWEEASGAACVLSSTEGGMPPTPVLLEGVRNRKRNYRGDLSSAEEGMQRGK